MERKQQKTKNKTLQLWVKSIKSGTTAYTDLKIQEIPQKTNNEQNTNTILDTPNTNKQEQSNRNEPPTSENRNTTHPNNTANTNKRTKNKF